MKVLFDANVILSLLLNPSVSGTFGHLAMGITSGKFIAVVSPQTVEESMQAITTKTYLAERIQLSDLAQLLDIFTVLPLSERSDSILRDPDDDYLIHTGRRNQIDILVTGDRDVLTHAGEEDFVILSPAAFSAMIDLMAEDPSENR